MYLVTVIDPTLPLFPYRAIERADWGRLSRECVQQPVVVLRRVRTHLRPATQRFAARYPAARAALSVLKHCSGLVRE